MTSPIPLPKATSTERSRLLNVNLMRRQALDRLYERHAVVQTLIQSLEDYQEVELARVSTPLEFSAGRKCS